MKRFICRTLIILIMLAVAVSTINIMQNAAATYSFSFTGPTQANNGDTLTYTITANGLTGNVKLSGTNVTLSVNQTWVEKNTVTITAKVTGFPASVTATPVELTDNDYNIITLSPRTIEISEKKTPVTPPVTQPTVPEEKPENQGQTGGGQTSSQGGNKQGSQTSNQGVTSNQGKSTNNNSSQTNNGGKVQTNSQSNNQGNQSVTKSSNNYLKNLQINVGTLSPEFYRETYEYKVDNIIEDDIEITAEAEDEKAIINGIGTIALTGGENRINIEVIAENEQSRTYTIIVNKLEEVIESDVRLQSLQIQTINEENLFEDLDIGFNKEVLDYETTVEDNVTDLSVLATVDREGIIVDVEGDKNLKEGENTVTITLTDQNKVENNESEINIENEINEDNTVQRTVYTIKVNRKAKPLVEVSSNKIDDNKIIAGIILVVLVIGLIMISVMTHMQRVKNKKVKH